MNRCPITYQECGSARYSARGLTQLSRGLNTLNDLPFSAVELRYEAAQRASRMSIQGVQAKVSARLDRKGARFEIVDSGGIYILKPPSESYAELPQNEDLTMRLAKSVGIEVPFHGMVYARDGSLTYFIRRFDRVGRNKRVAVEDFAQLSGRTRDTKYDSSMEQVATILEYCTFPVVEQLELFRRTLFCYLVGNEDMHLKNFSLITRDGKVSLAPAYDLLNSSIVLRDPEELALPLGGKKRNLTRNDLIRYFADTQLELTMKSIERVLNDFKSAAEEWRRLIDRSFLSDEYRQRYRQLLETRWQRIFQ